MVEDVFVGFDCGCGIGVEGDVLVWMFKGEYVMMDGIDEV